MRKRYANDVHRNDDCVGDLYIERFTEAKNPESQDFSPLDRGGFRGQTHIIFLEGYRGIRCNVKIPEKQ